MSRDDDTNCSKVRSTPIAEEPSGSCSISVAVRFHYSPMSAAGHCGRPAGVILPIILLLSFGVFVTGLISTVAGRCRCCNPSDMFDIFGGRNDNLPYIKRVTRGIGVATIIGACRRAIRPQSDVKVRGQGSGFIGAT